MSTTVRSGWHFLAVAAITALTWMSATAEDNAFMPKGGRSLLLDLLGATPNKSEQRALVQSRRTEPEWRNFAATRKPALTERELATLAAYLAVNLPLSNDAAKLDDLAVALPPDGRELAWSGCQNCHSLFAGYLMQDRELQAWRNIFLSPFHRELKLTPQQREEFARYSALNMPLKIENVPPDLRF